jgi:Spy/CpxP family protein refolding chaperone
MKSRTRALAVIFAVLLIGCILGVAGYHFFFEKRPLQPPLPSTSMSARGHTGRLADQLQLNMAQETQLNVILEESRREIDASRMEWESKLQTIRAKTNEKIAAILTDEQRKKYQQLLLERGSHGQPDQQGRGHGGH